MKTSAWTPFLRYRVTTAAYFDDDDEYNVAMATNIR